MVQFNQSDVYSNLNFRTLRYFDSSSDETFSREVGIQNHNHRIRIRTGMGTRARQAFDLKPASWILFLLLLSLLLLRTILLNYFSKLHEKVIILGILILCTSHQKKMSIQSKLYKPIICRNFCSIDFLILQALVKIVLQHCSLMLFWLSSLRSQIESEFSLLLCWDVVVESVVVVVEVVLRRLELERHQWFELIDLFFNPSLLSQ